MQRHFEQELEALKTSLIKMGSLAEEAISLAIRSFLDQNVELARRVIDGDERINDLEIEIDNAILDLLALQQPVAIDLRLTIAAVKINNDLERIGDHAVNIAESTLAIAQTLAEEPLLDIPRQADLTKAMLRNALDGFILNDPGLAQKVLVADDEVDSLNRKIAHDVKEKIKSDASLLDGGIELIRVSRNLERVADLATNIAEDVIFVTDARVMKHRRWEK